MRSRCQRNESKGDSRVVPAAARRLRPAAARAGRSSARASQRPRSPSTSTSTTSPASRAARSALAPLGRGAAREGEVHPQVGLAGGPHGAERLPQVPPAEALPRQRLAGDGLGHHPLGQVEALPEVRPGVDERAPAHPQVVEGVRGGLPVPPAAGRARGAPVLEVGAAQGTAGGDRVLDRPQDAAVLLEPAAPGAAAQGVVEHRPAPGREVRRRHQAGGVGPVLEQEPPAVDEPLHGRAVVGSEAAPQREVVGALDHVDGVDLEPPDVLHEGQQGGGGEPAGPRPREVLAGQEEGGHGAAAEGGSGHDSVAAILTPADWSNRGQPSATSRRSCAPWSGGTRS